MAALCITPAALSFFKKYLRRHYPDIRSAHLSEAIAAALGFNTHAAFLTAMDDLAESGAVAALDDARFQARLADCGYTITTSSFDHLPLTADDAEAIENVPVPGSALDPLMAVQPELGAKAVKLHARVGVVPWFISPASLDDADTQTRLHAWFAVLHRLARLQDDDPMQKVTCPAPLRWDIEECVRQGWVMAWEDGRSDQRRLLLRPEGRAMYDRFCQDAADRGRPVQGWTPGKYQ